MIQFYAPGIAEEPRLPEAESLHCARVLRMKEGDALTATDGKGRRYDCVITSAHPKHVELEVVGSREIAPHWGAPVELIVAPTKNSERMEWLIEKAVEIGVDRITLISSRHSERRRINTERLRKIMVSAMNQSLKTVLPELRGPLPLADVFAERTEGESFIAYCADDVPRTSFASRCPAAAPVRILIGPEGDFSPEEASEALGLGFVPVTFGDSRLRTETAALFALQTVHIVRQQAADK